MRVLIDTGPLVAVLREDDARHGDCVSVLRALTEPLFTCWPVLTEAAWLLRGHPQWVARLFTSLASGPVKLLDVDAAALGWIPDFFERYARMRPDLADACLVYLAEREGIDTVFTLDRRDFSVFRLKGKRSFNIIP